MKSQTLKVRGAVIYHEVRGAGPLLILIPGGPTDADTLAPLAIALEDRFTVVSYDPRGNSRSVFDGPPVEQSLDVHGDDAALLISKFAAPAFIFGTSGGAQIALNLAARYPKSVRRTVAHEPPCVKLLGDPEKTLAAMNKIVETFHQSGVGPAMSLFMETVGINPPARPAASVTPPTNRSSSPFAKSNLVYFLEHGVKPIANYRPDIEALKRSDIVVGVGRESEGQLAYQTGLALAKALGVKPVLFPGGHGDWTKEPRSFADVLAVNLDCGESNGL